MSGPEFEGVLAAHRPRVEATGFIHGCSCDEWDRADLTGTHRAHLSAALHAELARWADELADDWEACDEHGNPLRDGSLGDAADELRAALAALTTTDQEDHR